MKNLLKLFKNLSSKDFTHNVLINKNYRNKSLVHRRRDLDSLGEYIKIEN